MSAPLFEIRDAQMLSLQSGETALWQTEFPLRPLALLDGGLPAQPGRLFFQGIDLAKFNNPNWRSFFLTTAFLTPSGDLIGNLNILENLLLPSRAHHGTPDSILLAKVAEALPLFQSDLPSPNDFLRAFPHEIDPFQRLLAASLRAALANPAWFVVAGDPWGTRPDARKHAARPLAALRKRFPSAAWLFITADSELPPGFHPDTIIRHEIE